MNGPADTAFEPLRALLVREHVEANGLVTCLERESFSIVGLDPDRLAADTREKEERFKRLADLASEHASLMAGFGLQADRAGMAALFDAHPDWDARIGEVWRAVVNAMEEARTQNEANGRLIRERRTFFEHQIAALTAAARPSLMYGRDGHAVGVSGGSLQASA